MYSDVELNMKYDTRDKTKDIMALEYPFCTVNIILKHTSLYYIIISINIHIIWFTHMQNSVG